MRSSLQRVRVQTGTREIRAHRTRLALCVCLLVANSYWVQSLTTAANQSPEASTAAPADPPREPMPAPLGSRQVGPVPISYEDYLSFVAEDLIIAFGELRAENNQLRVEALAVLNQVAAVRAVELAARPSANRLPPRESIWHLMKQHPELRLRRVHEQIDIFDEDLDPTDATLSNWSEREEVRRSLLDPELDGIGVGAAASVEGETVIVVLYTLRQTALTDVDELERRVQFLVEQEREAHGLRPLKYLAELNPIARAHSTDMGTRRFFDHDNPDGKSPGDRARDAGHPFAIFAENLGVSYEIETPIESIVQGWMDSPGHRRNILDKRFTHTAVGVAISENGEIFLTQLFSRPMRPPGSRN